VYDNFVSHNCALKEYLPVKVCYFVSFNYICTMKKTGTVHPGIILKDYLGLKDISQRELSSQIDLAYSHLNKILKGERDINIDIALRLEASSHKNAKYWMGLQLDFNLYAARHDPERSIESEQIKEWKEIQPLVPIKYFKKKGIVKSKISSDINSVYEVYGVKNLDQLKAAVSNFDFGYFRKSSAFKEKKENIIAWSVLAKYKANEITDIPKFKKTSQSGVTSKLNKLFMTSKHLKEDVEALLFDNGIKFSTLDRPIKTPVDGVSFWSNKNPAIILTSRYKRLDHFAFTLMHEIAHVYLHLSEEHKDASFYTNNSTDTFLEYEADAFARNTLIPQETWDRFVINTYVYSDEVIFNFSKNHDVHPAIVRGRVCFENPSYYKRRTKISELNVTT
jgi:HTH-type transcriptional regulator/antitoxin HigA